MKIHNEFDVPLPPDQAWLALNDVPLVARCAPGAELLESRDDGSHVGTISVRLGPVLLGFKGTVVYIEIDAAQHRVIAEAKGTETKARGAAQASVIFALEVADTGTRVSVDTDVQLAGSIAQYGRGAAVIQNTAQVIMDQFAKNFAAQMGADPAAAVASAKPISGLKVLAKGVVRSIRG